MPNADYKPLVLVIDDSIDVHRLLQARLRHEQIDLVGTTKPGEAVEMAQQHKPATIALDPISGARRLQRRLRALKDEQTTNNIPVIVLSGKAGSEDKVTAFDLCGRTTSRSPSTSPNFACGGCALVDHLLRLLAERADVDGLTGLGNRAAFNKRWTEKVAESSDSSVPLSLAMLDVDFFKRINDTYGHPAGDQVLVGLAQLLQSESRTPDIACRYGGEEFALIMPSTGPADRAGWWRSHPHRSTARSGRATRTRRSPCPWVWSARAARSATSRRS